MPAGGGGRRPPGRGFFTGALRRTLDAPRRQAVRRTSGNAGREARRRWQAANTTGLGPSGNRSGGNSGGGGGGAAPVSTLAGLPKSPLLDKLIKDGLIKEGMPAEQALAILQFGKLREGVPIDMAALMKLVEGDYDRTTGDIETAGADWMKEMMGTAYDPNDPNAALFANDPTFSSYAGGLTQMGETADQNLATDLAWFRKEQEAQDAYYNDMMTAIATGTLPIGAAATGGGGGGGGGGGRGRGGGGGGGGGGGDSWTDPATQSTLTQQARSTGTSNLSANHPGFFDQYVGAIGDPEERAFNLDLFATSGQSPEGVLEGISEKGSEIQDFLDLVNEYDVSNAAFTAGAPAALSNELGTYNAATGFDPESGLVPDATAFPTGEGATAAMLANPDFMEEFPRQQQLASAAYDPGEIRRQAYEKLFDNPQFQQLLGMMPQPPAPAPQPAPPPSATTSAAYNPLSTAPPPAPRDQFANLGIPMYPGGSTTPMQEDQFANLGTGPLPGATVTPSQNVSPPRTTDGQGRPLSGPELQAQIDRELHTAGGAYNMIEDYDPSDPLKNVRMMMSSPEGRSNIEPFLESGAFQQMPPGQQAAVETFLQQRGIDTPGGTAEAYAARRNNRNIPEPGASGRTWAQSLAEGWRDRLGKQQNKQAMLGAMWANPQLFRNLMHTQNTSEDGDPIDFESTDINRAWARSATPDPGEPVRRDLFDILKTWTPTEDEWDRSHTENTITGEDEYHPNLIKNRYWTEPFEEERVAQAKREMGYLNEALPTVLEANTNVTAAPYRDTLIDQNQETNNVKTTEKSWEPEVALELTGVGDYDELADINEIDPIEEYGGWAGNMRGGLPTRTREIMPVGGGKPSGKKFGGSSRPRSQPQTKDVTKSVSALMNLLKSARQSQTTRPRTSVKKPRVTKPGSSRRRGSGRASAY